MADLAAFNGFCLYHFHRETLKSACARQKVIVMGISALHRRFKDYHFCKTDSLFDRGGRDSASQILGVAANNNGPDSKWSGAVAAGVFTDLNSVDDGVERA
jgi:hypothetical protein